MKAKLLRHKWLLLALLVVLLETGYLIYQQMPVTCEPDLETMWKPAGFYTFDSFTFDSLKYDQDTGLLEYDLVFNDVDEENVSLFVHGYQSPIIKQIDGEWYVLKWRNGAAYPERADFCYDAEANSSTHFWYDVDRIYGRLTPGTYRMVKEVCLYFKDGRTPEKGMAYYEFTVE